MLDSMIGISSFEPHQCSEGRGIYIYVCVCARVWGNEEGGVNQESGPFDRASATAPPKDISKEAHATAFNKLQTRKEKR